MGAAGKEKRRREEAMVKMLLGGARSWNAGRWKSPGVASGTIVLLAWSLQRSVGSEKKVRLGAVNALVTASPSLPSLTLFPFLPGSSAPSLAALRDMTVSTSTPPQTSLSALKSSGT